MSASFTEKAKSCCSSEKERVTREVARCNSASSDDYRHRCYRSAARKSGERSRQCMIS
jgi:hypothetical protein